MNTLLMDLHGPIVHKSLLQEDEHSGLEKESDQAEDGTAAPETGTRGPPGAPPVVLVWTLAEVPTWP